MRTFEFSEGSSHKFWSIDLSGESFTVTFGKVGTAGQSQTKQFPSAPAAQKEHDKLIAEKTRKGYVETTKPAARAKAAKPAAVSQPEAPAKGTPSPGEPPVPTAAKRTFEFHDDESNKFWNIEMKEPIVFQVTYGRIGGAGQTQVKTFADVSSARKEFDKLIAEKTRKGYRETTPAARAAPASVREALERALAEDPDDIASHMAYADYLTEEGDPLGEFIRVQLALEDETKPAAARKKLQAQEKKLLAAWTRTWLGELTPWLAGELDMLSYAFRRGWLDSLEARNFSVEFTRALARWPRAALLRELRLEDEAYEEEGEYEPGNDIPADCDGPQLYPLHRSPYLSNLRTFIVGEVESQESEDNAHNGGFNSQTDGQGAVGVVRQMPKLERLFLYARSPDIDQLFSLDTLHNLRELRVYHNMKYPLAKLAKNQSLGNLTHLLLHPHNMEDDAPFIREPAIKALVNSPNLPALTHLQIRLTDAGDKGVRTIIASGILSRLKVLDLRHGCVTDVGARALAACPDTKRLDLLDLTHNALTAAGIEALTDAGVKVVANHQWRHGEEGANFSMGDQEYLFAGDIE